MRYDQHRGIMAARGIGGDVSLDGSASFEINFDRR